MITFKGNKTEFDLRYLESMSIEVTHKPEFVELELTFKDDTVTLKMNQGQWKEFVTKAQYYYV